MREKAISIYIYIITLYSFKEIIETKEDFTSALQEYADNIRYILIFIFNGLINELNTGEVIILTY